MQIEVLGQQEHTNYDEFIKGFSNTLLYASSNYKNFLQTQTNAEPHYLLAKDNGEIVGSLPLFIKDGKHGVVINSLPFYGSNGGIISKTSESRVELIKAYHRLREEKKSISATMIVSPLEEHHAFYEENIPYQFKDERIGQVTEFPADGAELMDIFHYKTRNTIRKGLKSGLTISWADGLDYFDFLFETHKENIIAVGGIWKPVETFKYLTENFKYGDQLRIYVAKLNEQPVAALLLLYFNKTVEYFTPVTVAEYRGLQPMSAVIYTSMNEAMNNGYTRWNWGGTWLSQGGVYDFKARWGTKDLPYFYYVSIPDVEKIKAIGKEELLKEYPFFYVIPFSEM